MSFETYAKLFDEVVDLMSRGDLVEKVPLWSQMVESDLQKTLRDFRETVIEETGTLVADQDYFEVPDGFREIVVFRLDTDPDTRLQLVSMDKLTDVRVNANLNGVGTPSAMAFATNKKLLIAGTPGTAIPYTLFYHGTPTQSDRAGDATSQLLRDAPELLLYGCAYHGAIYTQNAEMKAFYGEEYEKNKRTYGAYLFRTKTSGGSLRVRPDVVVNDSHSRELTQT
jgi:hypothetical protein